MVRAGDLLKQWKLSSMDVGSLGRKDDYTKVKYFTVLAEVCCSTRHWLHGTIRELCEGCLLPLEVEYPGPPH